MGLGMTSGADVDPDSAPIYLVTSDLWLLLALVSSSRSVGGNTRAALDEGITKENVESADDLDKREGKFERR